MLTPDEVEARYERPKWASKLGYVSYKSENDFTPYYWVDDYNFKCKRVTSKTKLRPACDIPELIIVRYYPIVRFRKFSKHQLVRPHRRLTCGTLV